MWNCGYPSRGVRESGRSLKNCGYPSRGVRESGRSLKKTIGKDDNNATSEARARARTQGPYTNSAWRRCVCFLFFTFVLMLIVWSYFGPHHLKHSETKHSPDQITKKSPGDLEQSRGKKSHPPPPLPWQKSDVTMEDDDRLWKPPARGRDYVVCTEPSATYTDPPSPSRGYLLVQTNGGLNQMRAGICDMVAIARILNVTLVVPELDKQSFWADSSNFSDIFDEKYFIEALRGDVQVVKRLPSELLTTPKVAREFTSWSNVEYYEQEIAPLWGKFKVIEALKSDARLANNNLPADIQKLRCRVHYESLRHTPRIKALGKLLVDNLKSRGHYIALHLRYEKDMLAFTGCTYGLSDKEAAELTAIRMQTPQWKVKEINSTEQRAKGLCPLTPNEVGIFLNALGYPPSTQIYIAAGVPYGYDHPMRGFLEHFPNIVLRETIATPQELAPFNDHSSQMAALDYIVSVESDVFVPTYSGNMARAVEGHRRYLGHRKTIIPKRKELVALFDKGLPGSWLSSKIVDLHRNRQGAPATRRGHAKGSTGQDQFKTEETFYTNPLPDCLCKKS